MMAKEVHILNGSALRDQFDLPCEAILVLQECMIEGSVIGDDFDAVIANRKAFFSDVYGISNDEYVDKSLREISKINTIPSGAVIHLWFEYDLFCQTNMWFIIWSLYKRNWSGTLYFVAPKPHTWQGFAALSSEQLIACLRQKRPLSADDIDIFCQLWIHYQQQDQVELIRLAPAIQHLVSPIEEVIQALIDCWVPPGQLNRPQKLLRQIVSEHPQVDLRTILTIFFAEEGIYGFGDTQIRRMLEELGLQVPS